MYDCFGIDGYIKQRDGNGDIVLCAVLKESAISHFRRPRS
jgi:hypothetical protein